MSVADIFMPYLNPLAEGAEVKFDLRKFHWIGAAEKDDMMIFMRADAPYKSIGDIVKAKEPPRCGSTGVDSSDYVMSRILEETIGAKITTSWAIRAAARSPWPWKGAKSYAWA